MISKAKITSVTAREILDSRGNPTVEATVYTENGCIGRASVPSGASTGTHEARELRDGDAKRYGGKGVMQAVRNVGGVINQAVTGMDALDQYAVDRRMLEADGTADKSHLGANAILSVSMACARAAAQTAGLPLYRYVGGVSGHTLPIPYMNVLNGGAHAQNSVDVQEFMLVPTSVSSFADAVRMCVEVYHTLGKVVPAAGVGDEGGYAPNLESEEHALQALCTAVEKAGYVPGKDFTFALDAATSAWYDVQAGQYHMPKRGVKHTREEMVEMWVRLCSTYPISSLEDPMAEDDWVGWSTVTRRLGDKVQLVGDDLFVTSPDRLRTGAQAKAANAILIKPNQIGTLSETIETVKLAKQLGYAAMLSHRSGETEDTFVADLAVALNCGRIKSGAPCRTDRTAKYNRLMQIEEELGRHG